jgi:hypothetical protein
VGLPHLLEYPVTMEITRREAAAILDPPMTEQQVAALIVLAGITPAGCLRTGLPGRPPNLYDRDAISQAHATEAARTSKRFADNDWIAAALLGRALIIADPAAGTLHWLDGTRAEQLGPNIYGIVKAGPEKVPAHRVIWIAAEGEIPLGIEVRHRNRLRWDNRRANLELVTLAENIRHGYGQEYLTHPAAIAELAALPAPTGALPEPAQSLTRAGGVFRPMVD